MLRHALGYFLNSKDILDYFKIVMEMTEIGTGNIAYFQEWTRDIGDPPTEDPINLRDWPLITWRGLQNRRGGHVKLYKKGVGLGWKKF